MKETYVLIGGLLVLLLLNGCVKPPLSSNFIEVVRVKGGTFTMGCTSEQGDDCHIDEKPTYPVTLDTYYIGKYEVTQRQWREVMGDNPSEFSGCDDCPVENVSWNDVQDFLKKLNAKYPGRNYRLPTDAEWEYAARGGKKSQHYKYAGSNNIDEVAWYRENSSELGDSHSQYGTNPVGRKKPNELGLYDMSGNVWEWCSDWKPNSRSRSHQQNPTGPSTGKYRRLRGGSWFSYANFCRVTYLASLNPSDSGSGGGFRVAFSS